MTSARLFTAAVALHKGTDTRRMTATAALTWPGRDRAGDVVNPAGGRYALHKADPWVGYEHLRWDASETGWVHADDRRAAFPVVIGSARNPDTGDYTVVHKSIPVDGRQEVIPFGTTHFNPRDRLSSQTFALVDDDTLPAVSLELTLVKGQFRELDRSPLEPRPAYDLSQWNCTGWVHCAEPVNPGALTIRKGLTPAQEKALRLAESGKVGSEVAHPLLLKAFRDRYAPALGKSNTVTGGFAPTLEKAMPDADMTPAYDPDADAVPAETDDTAPAPKNGVEAFYDHAQRILDQIADLEADMESSDSPELIDAANKIGRMLEAVAEKIKAHADKHDAKLQAKRGGQEPPADDAGDDESADMDVDEDGVLKAMRKPFYKAIKAARARRLTKAEFAAAAVVAPPPADSPEEIEKARRELAAAERKLHRARLVAG